MVTITKIDESNINCYFSSDEEFQKVYQYFSVPIPGSEFMMQVKMGLSDGKKKFLYMNGNMLLGLKEKLIIYCNSLQIEVQDNTPIVEPLISDEEIEMFITSIRKELKHTPYEHQIKGFIHSIKHPKTVILSATGCLDGDSKIKVRIKKKI